MELDIRHNLKESFTEVISILVKKEEEISKLTSLIHTSSPSDALQLSYKLSQLVVNYRSFLQEAYTKLKLIETSSLTDSSKALLNKQLSFFSSKSSQLTELRQDLELVQRFAHTSRIY